MTPRICVSILPRNTNEAQSLIGQAEKAGADFIEVRLDRLDIPLKISDLSTGTKIPLIATNKLLSERGFFGGTEGQRQEILLNAAKNGFEYVDIDISSPKHKETINKLKQLGAKPIVSYHKFDGALSVSDLEKTLDLEIATEASVCKIIVTAQQIEDNLPLLSFVSFASSKAKLICFCMGEQGKISRVLSPLFGAYFTFASLENGSETAVGQMSVTEMNATYSLLGAK